ncbi:MAG: hypothetical protein HYS13_15610 [Planctomycetia bacterium]|nr:hypothetical protein [Planctomycetia bacterium]
MPAENESPRGGLSFAETIERQIVERTSGRIRGLRVELSDGCLIVHGFASSYYIKQLALHAAREMINGTLAVNLDVQIAPLGRLLEAPIYGKPQKLLAANGG